VLRDLKRAQHAHRRGEGAQKWRLYETPTGKVPKDLVTMFAGIPTPQIADPQHPFLTDGEIGALSEVLGFIDRHGARRLLGVAHFEGGVTPTTEKVRTAKAPLLELKIHSGRNNPRFLFVVCDDVAIFLTAFPKKAKKLRRADIARADGRFRTMKDGCS